MTELFDEFYIPNRSAYHIHSREHDNLIYGYDDEANAFKVMGYNADHHYLDSSLDFYDLPLAVRDITNGIITFVKIKENWKYSINLNSILLQLESYVLSKNWAHIQVEGELYGLRAVEKFAQDITNDTQFDLRFFRILMEHKRSVLRTIEYLIEKFYVKGNLDISEYRAIAEQMNICFCLVLKNSVKQQKGLGAKLAGLIQSSLYKEEKFL